MLDVSRIDPSQVDVFMKIQDMIVEPLAFDEEHLKFFPLPLIQAFLDDFTFVRLDDLVETTGAGILHTRLNLALLAFGACPSLVVFLHLILFTRFILQKWRFMYNFFKILSGDLSARLKTWQLFCLSMVYYY